MSETRFVKRDGHSIIDCIETELKVLVQNLIFFNLKFLIYNLVSRFWGLVYRTKLNTNLIY